MQRKSKQSCSWLAYLVLNKKIAIFDEFGFYMWLSQFCPSLQLSRGEAICGKDLLTCESVA